MEPENNCNGSDSPSEELIAKNNVFKMCPQKQGKVHLKILTH
jgi:hypothetical protein